MCPLLNHIFRVCTKLDQTSSLASWCLHLPIHPRFVLTASFILAIMIISSSFPSEPIPNRHSNAPRRLRPPCLVIHTHGVRTKDKMPPSTVFKWRSHSFEGRRTKPFKSVSSMSAQLQARTTSQQARSFKGHLGQASVPLLVHRIC